MKTLLFLITFLSPLAQASDSNIKNFFQVSEGIYRGGRPTDGNMEYLAELGIKTDINLQGGDRKNLGIGRIMEWYQPGEKPENIAHEKAVAESFSINFYNFPLNSLAPVSRVDDKKIDQILAILENPGLQPIFIHCEHGKDRTGLVIALYRVKVQKWSVHDAYSEWFNSGHDNISYMFTSGLDRYFFWKAKQFQ